MRSEPKYPDVHVRLSGQDGNAFTMIGRTRRALRKAGVPDEQVNAFADEAMSGDYNHVLDTVEAWVDVS